PINIADIREAWRSIESEGHAKAKDNSLPEHVRYLARQAAVRATCVLDDLDTLAQKFGVNAEATAARALELGILWERSLLWENERPARAGKRSIEAAKQTGRRARS